MGRKIADALSFRLDHVQLSIPEGAEDVCRKFYVDLLGFAEKPKPPVLTARGGLWLRSEFAEIHLGVEADFRPAKKAHPAFLVESVDELADHLTAGNIAVQWDDNIPGVRRLYCHDAVGNRLEFIQAQES